jgi:hypothetical protein
MLGFPVSLLAQNGPYGVDFGEIGPIQKGNMSQSDTLYYLDRAFTEGRLDYLEGISTSNFKASEGYRLFANYISQQKRINLNYRSEMATQTFIINNDERHLLFVDFEKSRVDNKWYVAGAYIMKNGQEISVEGYGFTPNDINLNFGQLARELTSGKGTGLYRKIRSKLPRKYQISPSWEKTLRMDDVIIYDNYQRQEKVSLTLRYYPPSQPEDGNFKSGWLIDQGEAQHFVLNEPNRDTASANLPEVLGRTTPRTSIATRQSSRGGEDQLSAIQCFNFPQQRYLKIRFEWQNGNSVRDHSIIRNIDTYAQDKKIALIGNHQNIEVSGECSRWLNVQPSASGTVIILKEQYSSGRIRRSKSYLYINLSY